MSASKAPWPTPLAEHLAGQGPMPVRDFMAEALYAPKQGFHTRRDRRRGSARVTEDTVYVAGLARQLARMVLTSDTPPRLVLQGNGIAKLARFLLLALEEGTRAGAQLHFVEPQLARRTRLVAVLQEFGVEGKVVGSPANLGSGPTLLVAKEHLGVFPVHWVEATEAGWQEVNVTFGTQTWGWQESLDEPPRTVTDWLEVRGIRAPVGHRYEVNLGIGPWLEEVASILDPGRVVVLDRAMPEQVPAGGTLQGRKEGKVVAPYQAPGEVDLSAAVDPRVLTGELDAVALDSQPPPQGLVQALEPHLSAWVLSTR